ncbi:MAG: S24/S26 family peptidase [Bacilli bacterium]|nr:S24/S26 family peptidase [Bacilli bacterium]
MIDKKISIEVMGPIIEETIKQDGTVKLQISGNSMRPFYIHQETIVCLEKVHSPLKQFDVVFYRNENEQYLLHRIINIKGSTLVICGDALSQKEYIDESLIIARVQYHERNGKVTPSSSKRYQMKVKWWNKLSPLRKYLIRFFPYKK